MDGCGCECECECRLGLDLGLSLCMSFGLTFELGFLDSKSAQNTLEEHE